MHFQICEKEEMLQYLVRRKHHIWKQISTRVTQLTARKARVGKTLIAFSNLINANAGIWIVWLQ